MSKLISFKFKLILSMIASYGLPKLEHTVMKQSFKKFKLAIIMILNLYFGSLLTILIKLQDEQVVVAG